jgi:hypothetical protein
MKKTPKEYQSQRQQWGCRQEKMNEEAHVDQKIAMLNAGVTSQGWVV